jgi:hypothetical protein
MWDLSSKIDTVKEGNYMDNTITNNIPVYYTEEHSTHKVKM